MARKSKLDAAFRTAERVSNPAMNLIGGGRPVTDAAKSKLMEIGAARLSGPAARGGSRRS